MIKFFDTTLRDGEQSPGCSMYEHEKVAMAKQLERLGVDHIEAGFAIASKGDFEAIQAISKAIETPTIVSLARATHKDIECAYRAIQGAKHKRIHTFLATSEIHLTHKLNMTQDEAVAHAIKMTRYAKSLTSDIEFSAEDATRSDPDFLVRIFKAVIDQGVTVINIPDTVGYTQPDEFFKLVDYIKGAIPKDIILSVHCHNDLGLAVSNTLSAIRAGATQVECTINGIGERAGNASLEEVVMALDVRKDHYHHAHGIQTTQLAPTSDLLTLITGVSTAPTKAIVGKNAFAHEAGIHQHGMLKHSKTYEIMTPQSVGRGKNALVLGKHSGKHALEEALKTLSIPYDAKEVDALFDAFKNLCDKKKHIYQSDLLTLTLRQNQKASPIILKQFNIQSTDQSPPIATVCYPFNEQDHYVASSGDGPLDACFEAINKHLSTKPVLVDYRVHATTEGVDAMGNTTIALCFGHQNVHGRGKSTDVIKAGILAYLDAIQTAITLGMTTIAIGGKQHDDPHASHIS